MLDVYIVGGICQREHAVSRAFEAYLKTGDVFHEQALWLLPRLYKLGEYVFHKPNKRLRAGIFGTLRERVQHRIWLARWRKQPEVRVK